MKKIILLMLLINFFHFSKAQKTATSFFSDSPIIIDGNLNESQWKLIYKLENQIDINTSVCNNLVQGPSGNNVVMYGTTWDKDYLYLGVEVLDDSIIQGDDIEVFFSMDNVRKTNCPANWPRAYSANDFQLMFDPISALISSPQDVQRAVIDSKRNFIPGGYTWEIKFSWDELDFFLPVVPPTQRGRIIGFDIGNNDADNSIIGDKRELMWNQCCSNRNWTENYNFGNLLLKGSTIIDSFPVNKTALAMKTSSPVVIDGKLDEPQWNLTEEISNQIDISSFDCGITSKPSLINNNKAQYGLLWDNEDLYVAVKVMDKDLVKGKDGIELFFNMDNKRKSNCPSSWPRAYGANDIQLQYRLGDNFVTSPQDAQSVVESVKYTLIEGGYTVEFKLIFAELDFSQVYPPAIVKGRIFGFDVSNDDYDKVDSDIFGQLMWNACCTNRNWTENFNFGYVGPAEKVF